MSGLGVRTSAPASAPAEIEGGNTPRSMAGGRDYELLEDAIDEAYKGIEAGHGYPFGAVVAKCDGEVIVRAHNMV